MPEGEAEEAEGLRIGTGEELEERAVICDVVIGLGMRGGSQ